MILLSIAVHEKPEVVLDQLDNFRKFAPDAGIVIHMSGQMAEEFPETADMLRAIEGVWVNTNSFYTGLGLLLKCHVSNFLYMEKTGIQFSHFCLHSSNDLFVKSGVEDYIRKHDYGFFQFNLFDHLNFCHWKTDFLKDRSYKKLMRCLNSSITHYVSQVEGTFYPRDAFRDFSIWFQRFAWVEIPWPIHYVHGTHKRLVLLFERLQRNPRWRRFLLGYFYTTEEFYPPNFFATRCSNPGTPYCFMNWGADLQVTVSDVEMIRNGTVPTGSYKELYSVKRIARDLKNPLRQWIRTLK